MGTKVQAHRERNDYGEKHQDGSSYAFEIVSSNVGHNCSREIDDEGDTGHNSYQRPADSKNEAQRPGQLKSCKKRKVTQGNTNGAMDSSNAM